MDDHRLQRVEIVDSQGGASQHSHPLLPGQLDRAVVQEVLQAALLDEFGHDAQVGSLHAGSCCVVVIEFESGSYESVMSRVTR